MFERRLKFKSPLKFFNFGLWDLSASERTILF